MTIHSTSFRPSAAQLESVVVPAKTIARNMVTTSPGPAERDNQGELLAGRKPLEDEDVLQAWLGAQQNSHNRSILNAQAANSQEREQREAAQLKGCHEKYREQEVPPISHCAGLQASAPKSRVKTKALAIGT